MLKKYNQIEPVIDKKDIKSVTNYLQSGGWITEHQETRELEKKISENLNRKYAIAVPNGTIAIYLALLSVGIKKGSKVAVPNITMIATINAVLWTGAEPILIDVDDNLCMSFKHLKTIKSLDAIIFVPLNGRTGNGPEIENWCIENKIKLIEDSAHALGSSYLNQKCGKLGDLSILSFTPHKIITMGQGGMILTDNKNIFEFINKMKTFNRSGDKSDIHLGYGLNFKITDLQATLGNSQFLKLEKRINKKKQILKYYLKYLNSRFKIRPFLPEEVPWFIDIEFDTSKNKELVVEKLRINNIEIRNCYPPLSKQKFLNKYRTNNLNFSEKVAKKIIWLPSSVSLKEKDIQYICNIIND